MKKLMMIIAGLCLQTVAWASVIPLQAEPIKGSRVIAKIDLSKGAIPIYRQKNWIKVGDPTNGNVGWIPCSALEEISHTALGMTPVFKTIIKRQTTNAKGEKIYRIYEYSGSKEMAREEMEKIIRDMRSQQKKIDNDMRKMMAMMVRNFPHLEHEDLLAKLSTMKSPKTQALS